MRNNQRYGLLQLILQGKKEVLEKKKDVVVEEPPTLVWRDIK